MKRCAKWTGSRGCAEPPQSAAWAGAALAAAAAMLLLPGLGATDLWAPDEPRYAQVAEELRSLKHGAGGLALLHLNGEPYAQKPPLYFWLAALAGAPAGRVTEVAARLPSALCGIAAVWLAVALGWRMLGPRTALVGGALLLSVFEFAHRARRAQLDVPLTLLEMAALAAFWRLDRGSRRPTRDRILLHGAMGLAVLTKGPVGLIVPLLVMATYLGWERRLRELPRSMPPWALLLSVGPGLVWLGAALHLAPDGTFGDAVVTNLFGRFFAGTSHPRPIYYYLYQFPLNFLPWTLLWPAVAWYGARRAFSAGADPERVRAWRLLLAWLGATLLFFTLSSGKRGLYLLPAFPAAALLCADAVAALLAEHAAPPRWATRALLGLAGAVAVGGLGASAFGESLFGVAIPASFGWTLAAAAALCAGAWRWLGSAPRPGLARLGVGIAGTLAVELAVFGALFPALDAEKSPRPVAEAAAALTAPDEPVGVVGKRSLVGGLVYYGGRRVAVLDEPGAVERFLAEGGRVMVVTARRLEGVAAVAPIEIRSRARRGRRALLVVSTR